MRFDNLTDAQKAKVREAKTPEELIAFAQEEGYELSDEELSAISGGWGECSDNGCEMLNCVRYLTQG